MPGFFFEGNGFFDQSILLNSTIGNNLIYDSQIRTTNIDMSATNGSYLTIVNHAYPINTHDVAIKGYVDSLVTQLGVNTGNVSLTSTINTRLTNILSGSFVVTITNIILNGPSAVFHITKNEQSQAAHIVRTVACPGASSNTTLFITWPANDGIYLNKNGSDYDGGYQYKIL